MYCLADRYTLGLLDPDMLCQCRFSRFAGKLHRCPNYASRPAEYLRFLMATVRKYEYDVVFPAHEQVYLLSRVREELGRHVGVAVPDFEAIRLMQSKSDFVRTLEELRIPVPETRIVHNVAEMEDHGNFPCYLKLAHSTAGTGVAVINSHRELIDAAEEFRKRGQLVKGTEILIQQPVGGTMCVVQAVFQHGRMIAAHCAESLERGVGGGQGFRVSVSHPSVVGYVRQLGQHLRWHGAMFLEYFFDAATGKPQFLECNPRIGETFNAKLCGINLSELLVRISLGEELEPIETAAKTGVRSHSDFFILLAKSISGATRREILREACDMVHAKGLYRDSVREITRPAEDPLSVIPAIECLIQLLAWPGLGRSIVEKTVRSYSLPQSGVERIHALSDEQLLRCFE